MVNFCYYFLVAMMCCSVTNGFGVYDSTPLVPQPQQLKKSSSSWSIPRRVSISYSAGAETEVMFMEELFRKHCAGVETVIVSDRGNVELLLTEQNVPQNVEGYALEVGETGVRISARDVRGIFYGIKTLENLVLNSERHRIPCLKISDFPGMPSRMVSVLYEKLGKKDIEDLKELVDFFASLKINGILLGLGPGFPYKNLDFHLGLDATEEDWREFAAYCARRHVKIMPYLQLLSHVNWLRYLGTPDWPDQILEDPKEANSWSCTWCPASPRIQEIWRHAVAEQIRVFQPEYFHIGMDEINQGAIATCPRCKGKTATQWAGEELARYVDFLKERNVKPVIWYDCFVPPEHTRHFRPYMVQVEGWKLLNLLPKDSLVMVWDYELELDTKAMAFFTDRGYRIMGGAWSDRMGNIPSMARALQNYGESSRGALLLSWFYYTSNLDRNEYRAKAGIVLAGQCFWNPNSLKSDLSDLAFDPVYEFNRRTKWADKRLATDWQSVPIQETLNTQFSHGYYAPLFTKEQIATVKADYFSLPERFALASDENSGALRAAAISGTLEEKDQLSAAPIEVKLNGMKARELAFLTALVPTDMLELDQNELFNFAPMTPVVGTLEICWSDGKSEQIPLRRQWNTANWNASFSGDQARFAARHLDCAGRIVHFSILNWKNPRPDIPLEKFTMKSAYLKSRALALFAVSAAGAKNIPLPKESSPTTLLRTGPIPPNLQRTRAQSITKEELNRKEVIADNLSRETKAEMVKDYFAPGEDALKLTIYPGQAPFGRVCVDIPVAIPEYATGVGFTMEISEPGAVREASYYIMTEDFRACAHYITKIRAKEIHGDYFKNMAPEGWLYQPNEAKKMRLSLRAFSKNPLTVFLSIPKFYEILPGEFSWNTTPNW